MRFFLFLILNVWVETTYLMSIEINYLRGISKIYLPSLPGKSCKAL